jgi:hypothetical protein
MGEKREEQREVKREGREERGESVCVKLEHAQQVFYILYCHEVKYWKQQTVLLTLKSDYFSVLENDDVFINRMLKYHIIRIYHFKHVCVRVKIS